MNLDRNFVKTSGENLRHNIKSFSAHTSELSLTFPNWYEYALRDCENLALIAQEYYQIPLQTWQAALLIAVLSPANKWETNKSDAMNILREIEDPMADFSFFTYGNNVAKARQFVSEDLGLSQTEAIAKYLKTPKIYNFFWSILDSQTAFCVDRHMLSIAGIGSQGKFPTPAQYEHIQKAFIACWLDLGQPCQTPARWQAYLWQVVVFTKHGISHY